MNCINEVTLVGNVGQDIDVRYTQGGKEVVNISLATSKKWKDKQTGEQKEKTEWHRVVVFGQPATFAAQYIKKGMKLYIRGELQTRQYEDPNGGKDRYTTEVVVQGYDGSVDIVSTPNNQSANANQGQHSSQPQAAYQGQANNQQQPAYQGSAQAQSWGKRQ